jgi:hypothetical protein
LASYDSLFTIDSEGRVETVGVPFGRPQGLAFDPSGVLHVVDALAGSSGVYALRNAPSERSESKGPNREPDLIVAGAGLVGIAFGPSGEMVVASSGSIYSFPPAQ